MPFVGLLQCSVQTSPDKETVVPFQPPILGPGHPADLSAPEKSPAPTTPHNDLSRSPPRPPGSVLPLFTHLGLADSAMHAKPALAPWDGVLRRPLLDVASSAAVR